MVWASMTSISSAQVEGQSCGQAEAAMCGTGGIERTEEGFATRESATCAANDWLDATHGWEGRIGADVVMTCSPAEAAAASRRRREALAGWNGSFVGDSFTWVTAPVLNRFTRLAIEMCAASATLRVAGYEYEGGDSAQRATQITTVAAA